MEKKQGSEFSFDEYNDIVSEKGTFRRSSGFISIKQNTRHDHVPMSPVYQNAKNFFMETKKHMDSTFDQAILYTARGRQQIPTETSECSQEPKKPAARFFNEKIELNNDKELKDQISSIQAHILKNKNARPSSSFDAFKGIIKNKDKEYASSSLNIIIINNRVLLAKNTKFDAKQLYPESKREQTSNTRTARYLNGNKVEDVNAIELYKNWQVTSFKGNKTLDLLIGKNKKATSTKKGADSSNR